MSNIINKKLIFLMVIFGISLIIIQTIGIRQANLDESIKKATAIAEIVKSGLTAHMVNGNMDQRDIFLKEISQVESIKKLWLIRGDNVIKQYGEAKKIEVARDDLDKEVLNSGKIKYKINDHITNATIRITIPYKAEPTSLVNCLQCHNVNYGDTLGAISIILDVTELKEMGILNILFIIALTFVASVIIIYTINKILTPYIKTLDVVNQRIDGATHGVFKRIQDIDKNLPVEANDLINRYNHLTESLMNTFIDIDKKLKSFVGNVTDEEHNPFKESNEIITNLSHLYQYKKEIQLDKNKAEIYDRFGQVCKNKFGIKHLNIFEINDFQKLEKVYSMSNLEFCYEKIKENPIECRVSRNESDVFWIDFQRVCPCFTNDDYYYYCIDIEIGKASKMILNFIFETQNEFEEFKKNLSYIKSYIRETAPEISTKLLMQALENSAYKDELTGLYNRKFFVEHTAKLISQAKREKKLIGVLMCDLDKFKAVNDEYGHDIGDKVLKETAQVLSENVRDSDIVFRMGGEEFVVLLVGVKSKNDAKMVAEKLRLAVSENEIDIYANTTMKKTISIGLAIFPKDSSSLNTILKYADIALYEAKESGRNKVVVYEDKQNKNVEIF
jgi:diguanylate cyclase (GGDEF)-like protein